MTIKKGGASPGLKSLEAPGIIGVCTERFGIDSRSDPIEKSSRVMVSPDKRRYNSFNFLGESTRFDRFAKAREFRDGFFEVIGKFAQGFQHRDYRQAPLSSGVSGWTPFSSAVLRPKGSRALVRVVAKGAGKTAVRPDQLADLRGGIQELPLPCSHKKPDGRSLLMSSLKVNTEFNERNQRGQRTRPQSSSCRVAL